MDDLWAFPAFESGEGEAHGDFSQWPDITAYEEEANLEMLWASLEVWLCFLLLNSRLFLLF